VDFKPKSIRKDKVGNHILIKRIIQQEDIMRINTYSLNFGSPNIIKQTGYKTQIDPDTILWY
jgi:hypothetical protein